MFLKYKICLSNSIVEGTILNNLIIVLSNWWKMSLWSRIKVELFNLGFVERNNNPLSFVFFFFFTLSLWNFQCKNYTIERHMKFLNTSLIFIFDFILNLYYFYCIYIYISLRFPLLDSNRVTRDSWKGYLQNALGLVSK